MYKQRTVSLAISVFLCLVGVGALFILVDASAASPGLPRYVATDGEDNGDCTSTTPPCRTVQYAVDAAIDGDVIMVAAGVYTGVQARPAPPAYGGPTIITQVVYISKTVTVRGGYTTTNAFAGPPDPVANPTTLDAGGKGRVLFITPPTPSGLISPTIEGLRIMGGDATGSGGGLGEKDAGGGVWASKAAVAISNCLVYSNTASTAGALAQGHGGGLYLNDTGATLTKNTIASNVASATSIGYGGGLFLYDDDLATLSFNTVQGNRAGSANYSSGGGLYLTLSDATLEGNLVVSNTASTSPRTGVHAYGGGLHLDESAATLNRNLVLSNTATLAGWGSGGGLYLYHTDGAILIGNLVRGNRASSGSNGRGGGLYLTDTDATLTGNKVTKNTANTSLLAGDEGQGGGLFLVAGNCALSGNTIISNTATRADSFSSEGGGLYVYGGHAYTLTNNVVAGNHAPKMGSGMWFGGLAGVPTSARLLHTTIAGNTGSGSGGQGAHVAGYATLAFTNTIIAGHPLVALYASSNSTSTLEATLWYNNASDTGGVGHIVTGTINVPGDPAFVNPSLSDYHLSAASAAINEGVDVQVAVDMDGQARPSGLGFDIGADEYWSLVYLPLVARNMP